MSESAVGSPVRTTIVTPTLLLGAGCLIALALGITAWGTGRHASHAPALAPLVAHRMLRFDDRADGAVTITDAATGATIDTAIGQQGFLRQTMRGLAVVREATGIGQRQPFELDYYADRRLILRDPATGRDLELEAFGPTNEAVFARYLPEVAGPNTGLATATSAGATVR